MIQKKLQQSGGNHTLQKSFTSHSIRKQSSIISLQKPQPEKFSSQSHKRTYSLPYLQPLQPPVEQSSLIDFEEIVQLLNQPLNDLDKNKKKMEKKQESKCKELILLFENKLDDEQRKLAVEAGISDALLKIVPSRNCSTFIHAFYVLTYPCSNEIRLQIYNKNPYPVLLNLLQNKNINIVQDSITSINNILAAGFNTTPSTSVHPHFESISDIKGIEKLFSLFMRNVSERTKYLSGFCLGSIFRNREIIDPEMKKQLMSYIYPLINSNDTLTQNSAKKVFKGLILNKKNQDYIIKNIQLNDITNQFTKIFDVTEEWQEKFQSELENKCEILITMCEQRKDDQLRRLIINAKIAETLLQIFQSLELNKISRKFSQVFYILTSPAGDQIEMMISQQKNIFNGLLRLFDHQNIEIVQDAIGSVINILLGCSHYQQSSSSTCLHHPHYDILVSLQFPVIIQCSLSKSGSQSSIELQSSKSDQEIKLKEEQNYCCNGIEKIYQLFIDNKDVYTKDTAAICIGKLYKSQIIENAEMRKQIIMHIVILSRRTDGWSANAKSILVDLALNPINKAEIEKN